MPIRIRDRSSTETVTRAKIAKQDSGKTALATPSFSEQLLTATSGMMHQDLDRLYEDVEEEGRKFLEDPTPETLRVYKDQVRGFVQYVVKHALKLRSQVSARELHQVIDRVDEELLKLADALLAREKPLMDVAAKVETINGLLLDMKV